jgi:transcriptional regulator with XRE-family HTH domain
MSQQDLIERSGVPRSTIGNLLIGQNAEPQFRTAAHIAYTLGVSMDEIAQVCGYDVAPAPPKPDDERALRIGRMVLNVRPLAELFTLLRTANMADIEQVVSYARGVVTPKE